MAAICSLVLASLLALSSDVAPTTAPSDEIDALIAQLGDDDWQRRQAAEDRLVIMGRRAEPQLERATAEADDPEVQMRAEAAILQIQENARIGPSIITIRGRDLPLREVFHQLSEQAGTQLEVFPPDLLEQHRNTRVTLEIDHLRFWEAMQQITEKTGFSLQQWDNTGMKLMQGAQQAEGISQVSGPYMISAQRVSRSRSLELGSAANVFEDFHVQLRAKAEPKLRLLRVGYNPNIELAIDEHGNSLLPPGHTAQPGGYTFASSGIWQLTARFTCPPNMGRRIARLKGTIDVSIQTRYEQLEVPEITSARGVNKVAGGMRFIVKELRRNGEIWQLDVIVRPEGAGPVEWEQIQQTLSLANLNLLDEHGESLQRTGSSTSGTAEQVEISMEFSNRGPGRNNRKVGLPDKLVWTVPTEIKDLRVPFEFIDLPIP
jgi:hypothetical protein